MQKANMQQLLRNNASLVKGHHYGGLLLWEKAKVPTAERLGYWVTFDTPTFISTKHLFSFAAFYIGES